MTSLFMWRIFAIAGGILFIAGIITLLVTRLLKNEYYYSYHEDELIKESKSVNSKNYLYFTSDPTTYQYIRRYVLSKTISEKYCICNYSREFNKVVFYIIQYNKNKKVIAVTKCVEVKNGEASRVIPLNRRTHSINVIVSKVDKMEINTSVIKPLSRIKILIYSLIRFFITFGFLFGLRHIIVELLGESFVVVYFNSVYDLVAIGIVVVFSLLVAISCNVSLRKKNLAMNRGGVIEYEFI